MSGLVPLGHRLARISIPTPIPIPMPLLMPMRIHIRIRIPGLIATVIITFLFIRTQANTKTRAQTNRPIRIIPKLINIIIPKFKTPQPSRAPRSVVCFVLAHSLDTDLRLYGNTREGGFQPCGFAAMSLTASSLAAMSRACQTSIVPTRFEHVGSPQRGFHLDTCQGHAPVIFRVRDVLGVPRAENGRPYVFLFSVWLSVS